MDVDIIQNGPEMRFWCLVKVDEAQGEGFTGLLL